MNIDVYSFVGNICSRVNMGDHMCSLKIKQRAPYQLKQRAERQAETRLDIIRAAVELHSTIGPAHTTVSAIAGQAGVQRLTVYRHFADDEAIFAACSAYAFAEDPPPDPEAWRAIAEPGTRLRIALLQQYAYYQRTRQLLANVLRDAETMPVLAAAMFRRRDALAKGAVVLAEGWNATDTLSARFLAAAIGHALDFPTWRSLAEKQGLTDAESAEMMVSLVGSLVL